MNIGRMINRDVEDVLPLNEGERNCDKDEIDFCDDGGGVAIVVDLSCRMD